LVPLWDTLDWLNPWQNADVITTSEMGERLHYGEENDLSPHL
jgi:hypothetical protein